MTRDCVCTGKFPCRNTFYHPSNATIWRAVTRGEAVWRGRPIVLHSPECDAHYRKQLAQAEPQPTYELVGGGAMFTAPGGFSERIEPGDFRKAIEGRP